MLPSARRAAGFRFMAGELPYPGPFVDGRFTDGRFLEGARLSLRFSAGLVGRDARDSRCPLEASQLREGAVAVYF